jgi:tRNA dimethylallyltransferase
MATSAINLIAIVGPTASGKTALAMSIAEALDGEIICVDSRTIYKGLDIGTAKPTKQQQKEIRHWGLDIVEPNEPYNAAHFKTYATGAIAEITSRNKLPIMVGGTGLYMDGVLYDFSFAEPNYELRKELGEKSLEQLQNMIIEQNIPMPTNKQNKLHLITAIERKGKTSERKELRKGVLLVGLTPDRAQLRKNITSRAKQMIAEGVLDEIRQASDKYGWDAPGLQGGIYKSMHPYIEGDVSKDECIKNYITSDMHLAKRQMTWLKRNNDITWFSDKRASEAWILDTLRSTL